MTRRRNNAKHVRQKPTPTTPPTQRVNIDFPTSFLAEIDAEADRVGVARQAFIKMSLADAMRRIREQGASK